MSICLLIFCSALNGQSHEFELEFAMKDEKRRIGFSAQRQKICSAFLFGAELSGVFALSLKAKAETLCSSTVTAGCTVTGIVNNGILIPSGYATVSALVNNGTVQNIGSAANIGLSTQGIANNNTLTTLTNNGTISAVAGAGTGNDDESRGGYGRSIDNGGSISMLMNSSTGIISGVGGADSNFGGNGYGLYNESDGTVGMLENSGTINGSGASVGGFGGGVYNLGTITLTNNNGATIEGVGGGSENSNNSAGQGIGITNRATSTISNKGTVTGRGGIGVGFGGGDGYGVDNAGITASLVNYASSTISGVGGADSSVGGNGTGIYNEAGGIFYQGPTSSSIQPGGDITTLENDGTVLGIGGNGTNYGGGNGYGFDNANMVTTFTNTGTISGQGGGGAYGGNGAGFYNEASGNVGILINSGTIIGSGGGSGNAAGLAYGISNVGTITTLSNSGTVEGNGGIGIYNDGAISALTNKGVIDKDTDDIGIYNDADGSVGTLTNSGTVARIYNNGTIKTLVNTGIITSDSGYSLYNDTDGSIGVLNNSGTIAGDIINNTSQALVITGGTDGSYGTLTGSNGSVGNISGAGGVAFTSGNVLLNDNIATGSEVSDNGAMVVVNGAITSDTPFILNSGMLEVGDAQHSSASYTGSITVNNGAVLRGHGTIDGDVTINAGGILAPGGSIGTLSITQNLTMQQGSSLSVALGSTPGSYDQIVVQGSAQLNGTLLIDPIQAGSTAIAGQAYNFLNISGSRTGSFTTVAVAGTSGQYLTLKGSFNGNNFVTTFVPTKTSYSTGKFYASSLYAQDVSLFETLLSPVGTQAQYWMHSIGSFGHAPGASYNYKGFVAGRGFAVNKNLMIGAAISNIYMNTSDASKSSVSANSSGVLGYGIYTLPEWTFTASAEVGHLGNNATRRLQIGEDKFATNGVYSGISLRADYEALATRHLFMTPYGAVGYLDTTTGSGQETSLGGLFDLHYGRTNSSLGQASAGFIDGYKTSLHQCVLTVWMGVGGIGTLGNTRARVQESIGVDSSAISAQIASVAVFSSSAGIQMVGNNAPWKLAVNWNGRLAKRANGQAFTLEGSYAF